MKQQILIFTTILCIAFAAGCKDQNPPTGGGTGITINRVPKDEAYAAIGSYGYFVGEKGYKFDSVTVAWLINGSDFLMSLGIDSATACGILQNAKHRSIHAYIGIPSPNTTVNRLNLQLYLVGADEVININDTTISDQDSSGIYNLTLPCPSACSSTKTGDTSLMKSFMGGFLFGRGVYEFKNHGLIKKNIK